MKKAKIFYIALPDEMLKADKLAWFQDNRFSTIPFKIIEPDENGNWINQTDNDFDTLIPVCDKNVKAGKSEEAIFKLFSRGFVTQRDEWVFDFDKNSLENKIKFLVAIYQETLTNEDFEGKMKIKWDAELESYLRRKITKVFEDAKIIKSAFRPFVKKYWYFDKHFNGRTYQWENIYANPNTDNLYITFRSFGSNRGFNTLVSNIPTELHLTGANQCLPLYRYENEERKENITDWALSLFRAHYKDASVTKVAIFNYVYAVLHSPAYRAKYEQNLKRDFPRVPLLSDFWAWSGWGAALLSLHLDYETVEKYPLQRTDEGSKTASKPKLKADKAAGTIAIDEQTTLEGVPPLAWAYQLGNRSALEWVLDQYKEKTPSDPTIAKQFNAYRFADYKEEVIALLQRVCTVSVRTMEIVGLMV